MRPLPDVCRPFEHRLIASCQAPAGDAFHDPESMARFALAAVAGGAAGIRANGTADVGAIRKAVPAPIIGIQKRTHPDGRTLITPEFEDARALVKAGATVIALDCTVRGQRYGAFERLRRIRAELGVPVMADIATVEEARAAAEAGADIVASTLRGYTLETEHVRRFEPAFIAELVSAVDAPVIAEGRITTAEEAEAAIAAGAVAIIVGTAITRPQAIARTFAEAVERASAASRANAWYIAIDLGGTNTKYGLVSSRGELEQSQVTPTPAGAGREGLLAHLKKTAASAASHAREAGITPSALGIATAGWVDTRTGRVAYATENLPGWTGAPIAEELSAASGLPVAVENDANALALAERHFGLGRYVDDFVCVTLGTGVGGGCFVRGGLNRGAHFFANSFGHITIDADGIACSCGRRGCLEPYANAAALVRYAGGRANGAADVIGLANSGDPVARAAVLTYAGHLATGLSSLIHLLDPALVILSGGIAQDNPLLVSGLEDELSRKVTAWDRRNLRVRCSELGYHGGVLGAAAAAVEMAPARAEWTTAR
ncbi:MAG: putative N-acetylmannosamine-6-phosphate 2-epimerase [Acidobacteriota bacterium]